MKKTNRIIALFLSIAMAVGVLTSSAFAISAPENFSDVVSGSAYAAAVEKLAAAGIVKGVGQDKFGPEAAVTTAQLVTFLGRIDGTEVDNSVSAGDFMADGWSSGYMNWAKTLGIIVSVKFLGHNKASMLNGSASRPKYIKVMADGSLPGHWLGVVALPSHPRSGPTQGQSSGPRPDSGTDPARFLWPSR